MPIHEYRCINCGEINEFMTKMGSKDDPMVCKSCGGEGFQKLMSTSNFAMNTTGKKNDSPARCCGADALRGDCTPGMCCGADKE
ncbi:MAG: zinc ribbon domain-containing protein [Deltaproteobacteria bacterium]|uniref:Zinc ribbon domain-containing protein n=1 Tax=Candidatus Zymogenus saltonus TaxID=2844893 RepID=A0A9D8KFU3_9DELT|nr:zinc ribbon domain-containing protein [Candidatus Zymogenus saltonus]